MGSSDISSKQCTPTTGISGLVDDVPLHTVQLEEFLPELQALIVHFHLSYDPRKLRTTADEMELFSMVTLSSGRLIQHINKSLAILTSVRLNGCSRSESVSPGVEGVQNHFQTTGADENVSSVRRHTGQTEPVGEEECEYGSEERRQLDPLHSGQSR